MNERNIDHVVQLYKDIFLPTKETNLDIKNRIEKHMQYGQFFGMISYDFNTPIGFIYGYRTKPGQFFHEQLKSVLESHQIDYWLSDAYELVEIAVKKEYRSLGVGTILHDALLEQVSLPKVILAVEASNQEAITFYENKYWEFIKQEITVIPAAPVQHVIGKSLI